MQTKTLLLSAGLAVATSFILSSCGKSDTGAPAASSAPKAEAAKTAAGKAPAPAKQAPGSSGPAKATPAPKAAAGGLGLDYGSDDEDAS